MSDDESEPVVVIDNGTEIIKAGLSGQTENASSVFPSTSPQIDKINVTVPFSWDEKFNALDVDSAETTWKYVYEHELKISPIDHSVLLIDSLVPHRSGFGKGCFRVRSARDKMIELIFETFNVPKCSLIPQQPCSIFALGKTDGLAVNCGPNLTSIIPVCEGYSLGHNGEWLRIGANDINLYLQKNLDNISKDVSENIKNQMCYVSDDIHKQKLFGKRYVIDGYFRQILNKCNVDIGNICDSYLNGKSKYELPDGKILDVGKYSYLATEIMFNPDMMIDYKDTIYSNSYEHKGIGDWVSTCLSGLEADHRVSVQKEGVVLCGGNSLFDGLADRIQSYLSPNVKVIAIDKRQFQSWRGGAVVASLSTADDIFISRSEYEENGPSVHNKKCYM